MNNQPNVVFLRSAQILKCQLIGNWTIQNIKKLYKKMDRLEGKKDFKYEQIVFDCSKIEEFDTHGIILILHFIKNVPSTCKIEKIGMSERFEKLFVACENNFLSSREKLSQQNILLKNLENLGRLVVEGYKTLTVFFSFVGELTHRAIDSFVFPNQIRFRAVLYHIENSGLMALPIIFLTSFLIGVVIAYQGAVQLEKFGANIFIVEMVTISATRELAPLLTAIVVAGRSASAYTAQIGVMKITDEIDAMRTMGFSPWNFLVLPRVFGLMISLPLLVFFADVVSIFGGMTVAATTLDVSFFEFIDRMHSSVDLKHFIIGLVKAPIFGWIVATIGCFRGFQIDNNTESVGRYTTISVVNAIFWVIAMDAIISVLLTELGL
ncbi:MAG: ABC transporter permease [Sulfurospirillaceae bacterium]|nr:ABC transporter permease [Sulfurospirillaceae bacterium]